MTHQKEPGNAPFKQLTTERPESLWTLGGRGFLYEYMVFLFKKCTQLNRHFFPRKWGRENLNSFGVCLSSGKTLTGCSPHWVGALLQLTFWGIGGGGVARPLFKGADKFYINQLGRETSLLRSCLTALVPSQVISQVCFLQGAYIQS